jgi:hypothetical protein
MTYANNPAYKLEAEHEDYRIYTPVNIMEGYSTSRYIEAMNQQIYAQAGATKEVLAQCMDEIILKCNLIENIRTTKTDIAALAQSIKYRLAYPVDQHCIIRMGCTLSFLECEDGSEPAAFTSVWQQKKEKLAFTVQPLYDFFLSWGHDNLRQSVKAYDTSIDLDYFHNRTLTLNSLTEQSKTQ